jgi:hypothetical protein
LFFGAGIDFREQRGARNIFVLDGLERLDQRDLRGGILFDREADSLVEGKAKDP